MLSLVAADKSKSFIAEFAELKGDIYRAKGDLAAARKAYQEALGSLSADAATRTSIESKMNDIAAPKSQAEASS